MDAFVFQRRIRDLVEPTVQRMGFDLVAVELTGDTGRRVLRLSIDGPEGVGAGDCAAVSFRVSPLIDEADPLKGSYHLEVSSPGIERPVQRLDDFEKLAGFRMKIRLFEGHPRRRYSGRLAGVEDREVLVVVDGQEQRLDYESIERAHLVLDLDEYERLPEILFGSGALGENNG